MQNDPISKLHIDRLEKARREEESKKKRVTADLSKLSEKKWNKTTQRTYLKSRASSMDNSILVTTESRLPTGSTYRNMNNIKQSLRDDLHKWNDEDSEFN